MDKLRLFKNKSEVFRCQFKVEGADPEDTKVRLCLEFDDNKNLFFHGELKEDGSCEIPIPALKDIKKKGCKLTIEAIADSTYFKVYEADVELKTSVDVKLSKVESTAAKSTKAKSPRIELEQVEVPREERPAEDSEEIKEEEVQESTNPYIRQNIRPKVANDDEPVVPRPTSGLSSYEEFKRRRSQT